MKTAVDAKKCKVLSLTGTMRGKERDELVEKPVFRRFLPPKKDAPVAEGSFYLVCTSAGEVGVNLSADHLICDLSPLDSMIQRFGRVNRFGKREDTQIDVVHPIAFKESDDYETRLQKTLALLKQLNDNASPASLRSLAGFNPKEVFSKEPRILPTSDILFDAWTLTTIQQKMPARPAVEPYLHGADEGELPTTQVAWREEVGVIRGDLVKDYDPEELLESYPLKPHELLQDRSDRVWKHLEKLAQSKANDLVWIVDKEGAVEVLSLEKLVDKKEKEKAFINYHTVLLSPKTGGFTSSTGTLDGSSAEAQDVADWPGLNNPPHRRRRGWDLATLKLAQAEKMRLIRKIDLSDEADEIESDEDGKADATERVWRWFEVARTGDNEGSKHSDKDVSLADHTNQVRDFAWRAAGKLGLSPEEVAAVRLAGEYHDWGKKRVGWQRSIGNFDASVYLAKSGNRKAAQEFHTPYRHEFGSLLDAMADQEFCDALKAMPDHLQDLVLHLIAAHHGRARPHFPTEEIFDWQHPKTDANALAAETPRRFARLQRRYGRWGLAFLESLLRAADYAASANPSATLEETP